MIDILQSQKIEKERLLCKSFIPRDSLSAARKSLENNLIKVITGPRRAGKSVFALQLLDKTPFSYINFDDERLTVVKNYDLFLKNIIQVYGNNKTVLFDEIQNLPKWELFVNRLQRNGYNIILTGSNANLLSRELATHLTGRFMEYKIYPFSFREYLKNKGIHEIKKQPDVELHGQILGNMESFLNEGGYPEVVVDKVEPVNYLNTLYESILFKDIVKRYNIRFAKKLFELGKYLISNTGREFSKNNLKNMLEFNSVHTVENYISYLAETFLLFTHKRFFYKFKEIIRSPEKIYGIDTGFVNRVRFQISSGKGRLMENLVALYLLKKKEEYYFYRDITGKEVDFLVKKNGKVYELIQCCYNLNDPLTLKREIYPLISSGSNLNCKKLTVITWDYEQKEKHKEKIIEFVPLWKRLLTTERL